MAAAYLPSSGAFSGEAPLGTSSGVALPSSASMQNASLALYGSPSSPPKASQISMSPSATKVPLHRAANLQKALMGALQRLSTRPRSPMTDADAETRVIAGVRDMLDTLEENLMNLHELEEGRAHGDLTTLLGELDRARVELLKLAQSGLPIVRTESAVMQDIIAFASMSDAMAIPASPARASPSSLHSQGHHSHHSHHQRVSPAVSPEPSRTRVVRVPESPKASHESPLPPRPRRSFGTDVSNNIAAAETTRASALSPARKLAVPPRMVLPPPPHRELYRSPSTGLPMSLDEAGEPLDRPWENAAAEEREAVNAETAKEASSKTPTSHDPASLRPPSALKKKREPMHVTIQEPHEGNDHELAKTPEATAAIAVAIANRAERGEIQATKMEKSRRAKSPSSSPVTRVARSLLGWCVLGFTGLTVSYTVAELRAARTRHITAARRRAAGVRRAAVRRTATSPMAAALRSDPTQLAIPSLPQPLAAPPPIVSHSRERNTSSPSPTGLPLDVLAGQG